MGSFNMHIAISKKLKEKVNLKVFLLIPYSAKIKLNLLILSG